MSFVHHFGAKGDGVQDDTEAIQHCVEQGDGAVEFARGDYLITAPIELDTTRFNRVGITGSCGTAKIVMAGAGPAVRIVGDHEGTASPASMKPRVWQSQRLPIVENIEIEGRHEEAEGIQLTGTVQPVIRNVGLHGLLYGVKLEGRNRNVILDGCQIYHNTGPGIWLVDTNLHQINIVGNHVSYNRLGGIRIERSEIRNLQITGNDIEYNNDNSHGIKKEPTAEIHIDTRAAGSLVEEVTIASNTIQATPSPEGANIRIQGAGNTGGRLPGLFAIAGNVIGNQTHNIHLSGCYGVSISGNSIYSAQRYNLLVENCCQVVVGANHLRRHTASLNAGVRFERSRECTLSGCQILDESENGQKSGLPLLELVRCQRFTISGCQLIAVGGECVVANDCSEVLLSGCTIIQNEGDSAERPAIKWHGTGEGNVIRGCQTHGTLELAESVQVNSL